MTEPTKSVYRPRIFEYMHPGAADPVRWIAAPTKALADAAAKARRWKGGEEIYADSPVVPKDKRGLIRFGCDVVVKGGKR